MGPPPPCRFLPRVHNRNVPISNKAAWKKEYENARKIHLQKLATTQAVTTARWGSSYNGVKEYKQASYEHVTNNLKRAQMQEERHHAINLENMLLLDKVVNIAGRNSADPSREYVNGLRLTSTQAPVIDHFLSSNSTVFGAAMEPVSLNIGQRRRQTASIEAENRQLLQRLYSAEPTYGRAIAQKADRFREEWLRSHESFETKLYKEQSSGVSRSSPRSSHNASRSGTSRPSRRPKDGGLLPVGSGHASRSQSSPHSPRSAPHAKLDEQLEAALEAEAEEEAAAASQTAAEPLPPPPAAPAEPKPEPEAAAEPEAEAAAELDAEATTDPEPAAEPGPAAEPEPEAAAEPEPEAEPEAAAETEPAAEPEPAADA